MSPDNLSNLYSGTAGAVTVLGTILILFIRGIIVPKMHVDELRKQYEQQLENMSKERDYFRSITDRVLATTERLVPPSSGTGRDK